MGWGECQAHQGHASPSDCVFDYSSEAWTGPRAIRLAFDFRARTATVSGGGETWSYAQKPGYRVMVTATGDGTMGAFGDAAAAVSDTLILDPDGTFLWLQFTATTESSTVWTCRPA